MLVTFEALTTATQKQHKGNGNNKLVPFVVLAMVKASAVAKVVISLLVCTMAKTLGKQCMHTETKQLPTAEANK